MKGLEDVEDFWRATYLYDQLKEATLPHKVECFGEINESYVDWVFTALCNYLRRR